ncbi:MAG: glutamate ABC transporter substrate-binding protein [Solirubrobacteraceae bacterium]
MRSRLRHLAGLALVAATVAGCGTASDQASRMALAALETPATQTTSKPPGAAELCTASLRPPATLPTPGNMPADSFMAKIRKRGTLIAGVSAGTLNFGYYNPSSGNIEGFEIDLVDEVAKAIFGTAKHHVSLVALTVGQREPFVQEGKVDIVADVVTMTCARAKKVDFSTVYYDAKQKVLVLSNSTANSIGDLAGEKVCATAGSTPIYVMQHLPHPPQAVGAPQSIDCLVSLQQGKIAGISTDSSILLGFKEQDPNTKIVGPPIADVPYGMEINKAHQDFVRFVNGVLAQLERNGTWQQLQSKWLGQFHQLEPPPKPEYDG